MAKDAYRYFRVEARELLEQLGQGMLALRPGSADGPAVLRLLRLAHTLKGAARVVKQAGIADHAHAIEDILTPLREADAAPMRAQVDALLAQHDAIAACLSMLAQPAAVPEAAGAALDELPRGLLAERADLAALHEALTQAHVQLAELRQGLEGHPLEAALHRLGRELELARESAQQIQLIPVARLFTPLQRAARDAAQVLGKQISFETQGGALRLEAEVLVLAQAALLQLVRNAVVHGIESEALRLAAGKPVQGRITVRALRQGRTVLLECSDDGAGLDLQALRALALRQGQHAALAHELDAQGLLQLLLRGGLSTAAAVNELAGRGVGLDVVRDSAERLGGEVRVRTEPGQGTTLSLLVPLNMAALEVMLVELAGTRMALPLEALQCTLRPGPQGLAVSAQGRSLVHEGETLPYVALAEALGRPLPTCGHHACALLLRAGTQRFALGVDRVLGAASLVLRELPELLPANPLLAGVALDEQARPLLVLDTEGLLGQAWAAPPAPAAEPPACAPVLVVDDSLTTRMLEQSILESAGYTVHAAVSAEEALECARRQRYALFLVDVEMPGMDGFSFVAHTRADPQLSQVPALLISSRSSAADKRRGQEVGASGYIVKSEFAQTEFLQQVRQLVGQTP